MCKDKYIIIPMLAGENNIFLASISLCQSFLKFKMVGTSHNVALDSSSILISSQSSIDVRSNTLNGANILDTIRLKIVPSRYDNAVHI